MNSDVKTDIVLAGVGGQGILTIAAVLGRAALEEGLYVKQAEVHGMAQRGRAVQSHFRISSTPIHSDIIPKGSAEVILSLEPMEALRYLPWLKKGGWVVVNESPLENIPNYPELERVHAALDALPYLFRFNGIQLARDNGSARTLNMVMLGAGAMFTGLSQEALERAITAHFMTKGDKIVDTNLKIFNAALKLARAEKGG